MRLQEARALRRAGLHAGAYYLAGYAIECALKACIAKMTVRHAFPDKAFMNKIYTHDLEALVKLANLEQALLNDCKQQKPLELNWQIVRDWTEEARYRPVISAIVARDMTSACVSQQHGILSWVRARW